MAIRHKGVSIPIESNKMKKKIFKDNDATLPLRLEGQSCLWKAMKMEAGCPPQWQEALLEAE